ncbi:hypothetical protein ACQ5JZ_12415 [Streptomyces sp. ZG43]|uniref:hypothetical protein n=1 Tax=Streptomyces TaxID=1883 RepID=UPI0003C32B72|nr:MULTISPECIES: hypothetical protein [unclassified Streptomyces]ESP99782.1 Hypothetical protein B591_08690 [Streptomyces sp. GBA 94-10 4N24]RPK59872.1 hypothetical protein EES44_21340 [Streptomyces sp. ADI96-15]UZN58737.1 Hypothetical protein B591N_08690 [Streptomyces sp. GBA 94-10 4N24]WSB22642.1 hypothetical protein OHB02_21765 [Streptomyces albidoflavus]
MTATGPPYRVPRRLVALVALPFVVTTAVVAAVHAGMRDRLPGELAVHFGPGGAADRFETPGQFLVAMAAMLLLGGAAWTAMVAWSGRGGGGGTGVATAAGWGLAAFLGTIAVLVLRLNAGAARAAGLSLPLWHLGVAFAVGLAGGLLGHALVRTMVPDWPPSRGENGTERLDLPREGRAGWARRTSSVPMLLGGVVLMVGALAPLTVSAMPWWAAIVLLLGGLLLVLMAQADVVVDQRGLTVRLCGLPWPRLSVPLDRVATAQARPVDPLGEFGGWGYRVMPKRSGLVYRSGEALVVRKTGDGREFAVTVDDAGTAAALLNTLAERRPETR